MTITDEELHSLALEVYPKDPGGDWAQDYRQGWEEGYRACEERMKADLPRCINCNGPLNFIASEVCSNCDIETGI